MSVLKYIALVPIVGETGYGTYLLSSSSSWGQSSTSTGLEKTSPKELPNTQGPKGEAVLEEAPVLPLQALEEKEENDQNPTVEQETPRAEIEVPAEPTENALPAQPKEDHKLEAKEPINPGPEQEPGDGNEMFNGAGEGSIGRRYEQYLIGTRKSTEWEGKVSTWRDEKNQNSEPFRFTEEEFEKLKALMADQCEQAYRLESFSDTTSKGQAFDREKYWVMVWTYCGKSTETLPSGWAGI